MLKNGWFPDKLFYSEPHTPPQKQKAEALFSTSAFFSSASRTRTYNPLVNSQMLYH